MKGALLACMMVVGCSSSSEPKPRTKAASPPPAKPVVFDAAPPPTSDAASESDAGPDQVYPDFVGSPLTADLDGDGKPETIAFECTPTRVEIKVGAARAREKVGISELVGCSAAVVQVGEGKTKQLVVVPGEHEEVGPSDHFMYTFRSGKLRRIWSAVAEVTFLADRSWTTSNSDCDDEAKEWTTVTIVHRFDGQQVSSQSKTTKSPVDEDGCPDDP
ncbi:MAG: hypothetical protein KJO07_05835 [Deltaproteobacteria bacterium]|nr:hypothetical protein [Deltaproteobacteria bacterium]